MAYGAGEQNLEGAGPTERPVGGRPVVVVPTRNNSRTIEACLRSLRAQDQPCRVVVVDNHSSDDTVEIARRLADVVVTAGPERSAQRNLGARLEPLGDVVGFVDSDMCCSPGVVGEATGGFDEALDAGADWDLSLRTRPLGPLARRRRADRPRRGSGSLPRRVPQEGPVHRGAPSLRRPYLRYPRSLGSGLGAGLVALRAGEACAVLAALGNSMDRRGLCSARPGATVAAESDT